LLELIKGKIYLHPLFNTNNKTMDQKKLEKLENIKNYLENDDVAGLSKYIDRIKPTVKNDEDFQEIFEELTNKNYDQALFITEDIILDTDDNEFVDEYDKVDLDDFDEKADLITKEPAGEDLEDFHDDFNDDFAEDQFDDDLTYFEDKDDDYY
jgi:hypothetical protein